MFLEDGRRLRWPRLPPLRLESWSLIWIGGGTCEYQCSQDALESLSSAVSIKQNIYVYILEEKGIRDFEILYIPVYDHMYSMYVILLEYVHTLRDKNSWSLVSAFPMARQRHASQLVAEWIAMNASKPYEFFQRRIADPCMTFRNT